MTLVLDNRSLMLLKDCLCGSSHLNVASFLVRLRSGWETSLKFGINLAQYVAMPKKLRTPLMVVGGLAFLISSTFVGSGEMPFAENTNPKKVMDDLLNSHFCLLSVRLTSENLLNTALSASSCSLCIFPKTTTSSLMLREPGMSRI